MILLTSNMTGSRQSARRISDGIFDMTGELRDGDWRLGAAPQRRPAARVEKGPMA
jgi:hypothetical protein